MFKAKPSVPSEGVLIRIGDLYINFKTESIVIEGEIKTKKKRDIKELGQKFATE
jgi:hypothetical protein